MHCDKIHLVSLSREAADRSLEAVVQSFESQRMSTHERQPAAVRADAVGLTDDGERGEVRPSDTRLRRAIAACRAVAERPYLSGA